MRGRSHMKTRNILHKRSLFFFILISAVILIGLRIHKINATLSLSPVETYQPGDNVDIGDVFFYDAHDIAKGYSLTVDNSKILSYKDFLDKYHISETSEQPVVPRSNALFPNYVYDVQVTFHNNSSEASNESGIFIENYRLFGTNFELQLVTELYKLANTKIDGMTRFALRPQSDLTVHLPFSIPAQSRTVYISPDHVKNTDVFLDASFYPIKRRILLKS